MSAALRRSGAAAPPSRPPRAPGRRDRWRAAWARRRGVVVGDDVVLGRGIRFDVAPGASLEIGDGAQLGDGCRFHLAPGASVSIGAGTVLGERCALTIHSSATIGERCVLADEVTLIDITPVTASTEHPIRTQGLTALPITIGPSTHLGPSTTLLPGATIPPGTTVGPHQNVGPDHHSEVTPRPPIEDGRN